MEAQINTIVSTDGDAALTAEWRLLPDDIVRAVLSCVCFARRANDDLTHWRDSPYRMCELVCRQWRRLLPSVVHAQWAQWVLPQCTTGDARFYGVSVIRAHPACFNWRNISYYEAAEWFLMEFADHVEWPGACRYRTLSPAFVRWALNTHRVSWRGLFLYDSVDLGRLHEYINIEPLARRAAVWGVASKSAVLTEEQITEYADYVHWNSIVRHQRVSTSFVADYIGRVGFYHLSRANYLPRDFTTAFRPPIEYGKYPELLEAYLAAGDGGRDSGLWRGHGHTIDWSVVSYYCNIQGPLLARYADRIDWKARCRRWTIDADVLSAHRDRLPVRDCVKYGSAAATLNAALMFSPWSADAY